MTVSVILFVLGVKDAQLLQQAQGQDDVHASKRRTVVPSSGKFQGSCGVVREVDKELVVEISPKHPLRRVPQLPPVQEGRQRESEGQQGSDMRRQAAAGRVRRAVFVTGQFLIETCA